MNINRFIYDDYDDDTVTPVKYNHFKISEKTLLSYIGDKTDKVVVPESIKIMEPYAFKETIENLILPKSLKEINTNLNAKKIYMFGHTKINFNTSSLQEKIEEIVIKNIENDENIIYTLEEINENYYYLSKLRKIVLIGTPIKEEYQEKLTSLKKKLSYLNIEVIIPEEFEIKNGTLIAYNGNNTNVIIPEGVKIIASGVFANRKISNIILPESLEQINSSAFANNNLEKVVIPKNVHTVSDYAFDNNPNLKTLEIKGFIPVYIPNIEHLILSESDSAFILRYNKKLLKHLKTLTISDTSLYYSYIKEIIENLSVTDLKIILKQGNGYHIINGKLNSITINTWDNNFINLSTLSECYKIYLNNSNGNIVKEFIDYIKQNHSFKFKNIGMIIVKGKPISLLEKLKINKILKSIIFYSFEPNEELEEETVITIDNTVEDEEISELLNEITALLNTYISKEDKNKIFVKINNIINKYKNDLAKIKPQLFNEKPKFGEEILTPSTLRMNLIIELNNILIRLKTNNTYLKLKKDIDELERLLNNKDFETPNTIDTLKDKVKYIINKSNIYKKYNFTKELQEIFNEIQKQISNVLINFDNNTRLTDDIPLDKLFYQKIDTLYEKVKRIIDIEEIFNNENSELAQDINTIKYIISNFSIEHQSFYKEKLDSLINKFYQELINGQREDLSKTILEIRKEWQPLLEELNLNANIYIQHKELIDELNGEKNNRISTIEILINEINDLKENNNLDNITKTEISNKLESLINTWKRKLIKTYTPEEKTDPFEEILKNQGLVYIPKLKTNNICIEIEIEIAKELLNLKNEILAFIQSREDYEKLAKTIKNLKISE